MSQLRINFDRCTLCQICLDSCPFGALSVEGDRLSVGDDCNLCGACVPECPEEALDIPRAQTERVDLSGWGGVWVFAEQTGGELAGVAYELLGEARRLADASDQSVSAVLLGSEIDHLIHPLIRYGADRVMVADDPVLEAMRDEPYTSILCDLVEAHRPSVILMGATVRGRSLAPRLAARLGTGLTADCTELDMDDEGNLIQTRPAFGGNVMATIVCKNHRPQMATVRPRVMKPLEPDPDRQGEILEVPVEAEALEIRTVLLEAVEEAGEAVKIEEADIIVAGGRGLGNPDGFQLLQDLAKTLGAAVAASRPVVDSGWIPYPHQVGQTGKTVSPKVYIACGISGAIQHMAGMRSSDVIIAINRNPDAPIFKIATYGLVGDLFQIVPALKREIEALRDNKRGG